MLKLSQLDVEYQQSTCKCKYLGGNRNVEEFYGMIKSIATSVSNLCFFEDKTACFVQYKLPDILILWTFSNEWTCSVGSFSVTFSESITNASLCLLTAAQDKKYLSIHTSYIHVEIPFKPTKKSDIHIYEFHQGTLSWRTCINMDVFYDKGYYLSFCSDGNEIYMLCCLGTEEDLSVCGFYRLNSFKNCWLLQDVKVPNDVLESTVPPWMYYCFRDNLHHIRAGSNKLSISKDGISFASRFIKQFSFWRDEEVECMEGLEPSRSLPVIPHVNLHHPEYSSYSEETEGVIKELRTVLYDSQVKSLVEASRESKYTKDDITTFHGILVQIYDIRMNQFVIYNCLYNVEARIGRSSLSPAAKNVLWLLETYASNAIIDILKGTPLDTFLWIHSGSRIAQELQVEERIHLFYESMVEFFLNKSAPLKEQVRFGERIVDDLNTRLSCIS